MNDHPNQLAPGGSFLNYHISQGKIPGGAEGKMIRKKQEEKLKELEETDNKHIIK